MKTLREFIERVFPLVMAITIVLTMDYLLSLLQISTSGRILFIISVSLPVLLLVTLLFLVRMRTKGGQQVIKS